MKDEISELVELAERGRLFMGDCGIDAQPHDEHVLRGVSLLAEALGGLRDLVREEDMATVMQAIGEMEPATLRLLLIVACCQLEVVGYEVVP